MNGCGAGDAFQPTATLPLFISHRRAAGYYIIYIYFAAAPRITKTGAWGGKESWFGPGDLQKGRRYTPRVMAHLISNLFLTLHMKSAYTRRRLAELIFFVLRAAA